jgi:hypothetical protein
MSQAANSLTPPPSGATVSAQGAALSRWERELRGSGPVHAIQHELLNPWGLKTPRIMAE